MTFKEYPHIENAEHEKSMALFLEQYPEMKDVWWTVEEKINGSNMQINISPQGDVELCSRGRVLPADDDHYGFKVFIKERFNNAIDVLKGYAKGLNINLRVYGEYFGPKICKGVDYGKERRFIIFGMMRDEEYVTPEVLYETLAKLGLGEVCIRNVAIVSYASAMKFDTKFPSLYSPSNDLCEGVVIKPFKNIYLGKDGKAIYIKIKNEQFKDKQRAPSEKIQGEAAAGILLPYLNENRIQSYYSKFGIIKSKAQIGEYIKGISADIIADWQSENGDLELDAKERSVLGPLIVKFLMKDL